MDTLASGAQSKIYCPFHELSVDSNINEPFSVKFGLNESALSIDPGQPEQSTQADLGLNFFKVVNILHTKEP